MKKLGLALGLFFILSSIILSQQNYFPLEVGNYWQFIISSWESGSGITTYGYDNMEVLKDTSFSNSILTYKKVKHILLNEWTLVEGYIYLRYDSTLNSILSYDIFQDIETVFINFNATLFKNWENSLFGTIRFIEEDTVTVFNLETNYKFYDWGTGWYNAGISLANNLGPTKIIHSDAYVIILIDTASIIYAKINGIEYGQFVSVNDEQSGHPDKFYLSQNYPNPFNPNTKISWQSPVGSLQTLKVYDVLGNEVATLVNEYKPAGSYEAEFKSTVGSHQLANGVYFYRLHVGEYVETKKMILLK